MDLIGQRIGNFALTRVLGVGGMGIVYLAQHTFLERKKAVKILLQEAAEKPVLVRRFFDEAMAASACQHDHIVSVEDCGTFRCGGEDHHYIEMELLEGMNIGEALRPPHAPNGRFEDIDRAARIVADAADALGAAHARGIVHRDVKPENLFLARRGQREDFLKVLDFGIARLTGDLAPGSRTRTGAVMGTPEYMSPEQARGHHPDGKSDVFSLGIVLYRMLGGQLPFRAETFTLLAVKITNEPPPPIATLRPDTPPGIVRAIEAAMRKQAVDRPSMRELQLMLLDSDAAPRAIAPEWSTPTATSHAKRVAPPVAPPASPAPIDTVHERTAPGHRAARRRDE